MRKNSHDRRLFNGLIWLARSGSQWKQWKELPRRSGPKSTVHARFCERIAHGQLEHGRLEAAWALLLQLHRL